MKGVKCISVLKALGEVNRLRIMRLLLNEELGTSTVADRLHLSQYNVSKHLRILREAGLLQMQKAGKERLYRVMPELKDPMRSHCQVLELGCCSFRFDRLPR